MDFYSADIISYSDYYPFGMLMPNRHGQDDDYRYGFQGQEMDDEVNGSKGTSYTAEFWQYDSRLGRRWNIDPVVKHHESPYATFANNPVWMIDPNGADTLTYGADQQLTYKAGGEDVFYLEKKLFVSDAVADMSMKEVLDANFAANQSIAGDPNGKVTWANGVISATTTVELDIEGVKDFLGTIVGESSNNEAEAEGIGNVILNRLSRNNSGITVDGMNSAGNMYARDNTDPNSPYQTIKNSSLKQISEYTGGYGTRINGALRSIQLNAVDDNTDGAYFWEGHSHYVKSTNYFKVRVDNKTFIHISQMGESHFFKYNNDNKKYKNSVWP